MLVIFLSGPINAGKTTVAKAICSQLPETAHVEIDSLRAFVEWMELRDSVAMNLENGQKVCQTFLSHGLNCVVGYPLTRAEYEAFVDALSGFDCRCEFFSLSPPIEVALTNRGSRELSDWERDRIKYHYETGLHNPGFGHVIDNAELTPEETAQKILTICREV